jgi:signal transduction histidine kinase
MATVQLILYPDHVHISVEDNGRGINAGKEGLIEKGIGLRSLISRVEYLKGTIHIDSQTGKGTMVMIDIPVSS